MAGLFCFVLPTHLQAKLTLDAATWAKRRRADGINLLIAQPDIVGSADTLTQLYFSKDKVEKDFRTIKSVLALRPVHHRTDEKVRAHVTLCTLALLIERTLEQRLANAGLQMTAPAAFTELATCHLNEYEHDALAVYTTQTTPEQNGILDALGLEHLCDDEVLAERLHPR